MKKYRSNVAALVLDAEDKILVFERSDHLGWGFPQGGKEAGESDEDTLRRELSEELGTTDYELLAKAPSLLRYDFVVGEHPLSAEFAGQEQQYFLVRLTSTARLDFTTFPEEIEFLSAKALSLSELWAMDFGPKNQVYRQVLDYFKDYLK